MPTNLEDTETQDGIDTEAALADISTELFGQDDDGDKTSVAATQPGEGEPPVSGETSGTDATEAPLQPAATAETTSEEVQAIGAPKTWTKEALAEWSTVPPRVQQEILKREEDFLNGITQYKQGAELGQRYDSVVEPYRAALAAENVDPVQLFQSFSANHYLLSKGTPEQKAEIAASLITGYGIDVNQLADKLIARGTPAQIDPTVAALQKELAEVKGFQQKQAQSAQEAAYAKITAEIDAFAADPAHPYFDALVDDISKLMQSGLATSLQDAYDRAAYANPATRELMLAQTTSAQQAALAAAEKARMDKRNRSTGADITTTPRSRNGTVPKGSIDDTLAETLAAINGR